MLSRDERYTCASEPFELVTSNNTISSFSRPPISTLNQGRITAMGGQSSCDKDNWREQANCRGVETSVMFPEPGNLKAEEAAKAFCRACVVKNECLDTALAKREFNGVWGGTGEEERRRLLKILAYNS